MGLIFVADGLATALELMMAETGGAGSTREAGAGGAAAGETPAGDLFGEEADAPMLVEPIPRGRGRPPGARNRSTEEWRQYLLGRYRSPIVALLELASRSPKQLAEELGLYERVKIAGEMYEDRLATGEALKAQITALTAVLPYLHAKAPVEIQVKDDGPRGVLVIGELNVSGVQSDGLRLPDPQSLEHQQVIDVCADDVCEKSDGALAIAEDKPL